MKPGRKLGRPILKPLIVEALLRGTSNVAIAERFNCGPQYVREVARVTNIMKPRAAYGSVAAYIRGKAAVS